MSRVSHPFSGTYQPAPESEKVLLRALQKCRQLQDTFAENWLRFFKVVLYGLPLISGRGVLRSTQLNISLPDCRDPRGAPNGVPRFFVFHQSGNQTPALMPAPKKATAPLTRRSGGAGTARQ